MLQVVAASPLSTPFEVDIRADSNRDGTVDIHGTADLPDKHEWSNTAGAIFLANIGDTDRRCSKIALEGPPLSNEELAACNDASDDVQRAPQFMAPLRTVPIPDLDDSAVGRVSIEDEVARNLVRIFRRDLEEKWVIVSNEYEFTAEELRCGLELGIDARDTRRPGVWDGRVSVRFDVSDGQAVATDSVNLRVAPVLAHHHVQSTVEVFSTTEIDDADFYQTEFISNLTDILDEKVPDLPVFLVEDTVGDMWAQDFFEPGYTSMPGPNGTVALQIMIRSAQDSRDTGRLVFERLRKTGRGAVYYPGGPRNDINAMGNFEAVPPYTFNGKEYPAGRIFQGTHGSVKPHILPYFQAQEVQDPILLDTDWLSVGHVDEFIEFLPFDNPRGWVALVADPNAGLDVLREAQSSGHGSTRAFSRQNDTRKPPPYFDWIIGGLEGVPDYTIDELLSQEDLLRANAKFSKRIAANIDIIKQETGVTDEEIFHVPNIFRTGMIYPPGAGISPERNDSSEHGSALYPSPINGVVLSETVFLAPDPWGPVISGRDIMADAISAVYKKVGFEVSFLDNWYSHHKWGGEVHCGTNTRRDASIPWW